MYEMTGKGVLLGRKYVVSNAADNRSIQIKEHRRKRDKLLFTMVRGQGKIFIYKKNYTGLKIEQRGNGFDFSQNRKLVARYELK